MPSLSFNVSEWSVIALRFISDKISDGFSLVPCRLWDVRRGEPVAGWLGIDVVIFFLLLDYGTM